MPHISLETTSDVVENQDIVDILERLVARLSTIEQVRPASIKAYHVLRHTWLIGEGGPNGFIHCEISVMSGRGVSFSIEVANVMHAELLDCFKRSQETKEAGITLEVREMDHLTYRK